VTRRTAGIVVESTCCLPADLVACYDIAVVPVPFVFGTQTFLDGVDMTAEEFYRRLVHEQQMPQTSSPEPGAYLEAIARLSRVAEAVLCLSVAEYVSTMVGVAATARDLARERLPDTRVEVLDSGTAAMGQGFVALAAARAVEAGTAFDAMLAEARSVSERVTLVITLETYEYLSRAARIPRVAALVGGMLPIKPIIRLSQDRITLVGRARTKRKAVEEIVGMLEKAAQAAAERHEQLHVAVQHAAAGEEAAALEERVRREFAPGELFTTSFSPVMGAYAGPGLIGLAYYTG
jgi:DegV family protein with EDD domain